MYLSTGTGFVRQDWANQDWGKVGDFNSDGLADLFVLEGTNGTTSKLLISTGTGFEPQAVGLTLTNRANYNWEEFEGAGPDNDMRHLGTWFQGDFDGDGTSDLVQYFQNCTSGCGPTVRRYRSTGYGLVRDTTLGDSPEAAEIDAPDTDGDGRSGLRHGTANGTSAYIVNGDALTSQFSLGGTGSGSSAKPPEVYWDANGDGKGDLYGTGTVYNNSVLPDLLKTHTLSSGGSVDVAYLPSTYWQ
ncbi:MAG: hypothetical protein ABL866_02325, partial [Devosia sp.]